MFVNNMTLDVSLFYKEIPVRYGPPAAKQSY